MIVTAIFRKLQTKLNIFSIQRFWKKQISTTAHGFEMVTIPKCICPG